MTMDPKTRGDLASNILNNQVFDDSFVTLKNYYTDKMATTTPDQVEERNKWHYCLFVLNGVKTALSTIVQNGKVEEVNTKLREQVTENDSGKRND